MAQTRTVWLTGAASIAPVAVLNGPTLADHLNISATATYQASKASPLSVSSTTEAPYTVSLDSITKVRFMILKVRSGSVTLQLTSAAGTDQKLKVSDQIIWHAPNAGDEITAIKLVGTADVELLLAGDLS